MNSITRTCLRCSQPTPHGGRAYCSQSCYYADLPRRNALRDRSRLVACAHCGQTFSVHPNGVKKFCSVSCHARSGIHRRPVAERFWPYVNKTEGCWLWTGATRGNGYGVSADENFRAIPAHRLAWILTHGPIEGKLEVCHNCPGGDNPRCVRPDHMFLGTHQENIRDAVAKGQDFRGPHGHKGAVLSKEQVLEIRRLHSEEGATRVALARQFGVTSAHVGAIIARRSWKHV